jgi:3-hydroxyisobutyrate dehydrogenase
MTSGDRQPVGFIGLGQMGYPMASRLHAAGEQLQVHDLDRGRTGTFVAQHAGAVAADIASGGFDGVHVVILSLPDSTVVERVVLGADGERGLIDALPGGSVVIDMSSSEPMRTRVLAERLVDRGLHLLDAPVSGGVKGAVDGTLTIMVGGDGAQADAHRDLLGRMGSTVTYVGATGAGHAMKALNNYVSAAGLVAAVEALHAAAAFGLDPAVLVDVLNSSTGRNYTTENKAKQFMLSRSFDSGFALALMAKDVRTAVALGETVGGEMRLGRLVADIWTDADRRLGAGADHTEMHRYLEDQGSNVS